MVSFLELNLHNFLNKCNSCLKNGIHYIWLYYIILYYIIVLYCVFNLFF